LLSVKILLFYDDFNIKIKGKFLPQKFAKFSKTNILNTDETNKRENDQSIASNRNHLRAFHRLSV